MKIAFDAQLLMEAEKTGIGWCAENIVYHMSRYDHDLTFNCFTFGKNKKQLMNIDKYKQLGYRIKKCPWFHYGLYRIISNIIPIPYSLLFHKKVEVTIFFNYVIPPMVRGKKVVFVYDMSYKTYPETVRTRTKNMLNMALKRSCKRADVIITVSEYSKSEIIRYLNVAQDKITVMPTGVDFTKYHPNYTQEEVKAVKEKYDITNDYLLYLGTLEPRKNITRLIQAYALLKEKKPEVPKLVLAGRKGWLYDSIFDTVLRLQLEEHIIFTGYIEAEDAPILMKGALAFLFPSIYEGFGMPPLEAMACGTPVLVSNTASLPEVVGDTGILVDPMSVESICNGIESLLENKDLRNHLSRRGIERASQFSWDRSVEIINNVIKELA